ncbi:hypothetical protein JD969_12190 [Planctomycetota bacterium]|nr:hypothetical protein JD969_12190 [Planctomycetota bacterium]
MNITQTSYIDLTSNQPLDIDVNCIKCDYNLRTLTTKHLCPECEHPVISTLQEPYLCLAPLTQLKTLRRSITHLLLAPIYCFLPLLIVLELSYFNLLTNSAYQDLFINITIVPIIAFIIFNFFRLTNLPHLKYIKPRAIKTLRVANLIFFLTVLAQVTIESLIDLKIYEYQQLSLTQTTHLSALITPPLILSFGVSLIILFSFLAALSLGSMPDKHKLLTKISTYTYLLVTIFFALLLTFTHARTIIVYELQLDAFDRFFKPLDDLMNYSSVIGYTLLFILFILTPITLFYFRRILSKLINHHPQNTTTT